VSCLVQTVADHHSRSSLSSPCRYDNVKAQSQFLQLGVLPEIISILKRRMLRTDTTEDTDNPYGPDSDLDSKDAGPLSGCTLLAAPARHALSLDRDAVLVQTIDSSAEVEWAVKALTNMIQV
jgi:hypothetical protein